MTSTLSTAQQRRVSTPSATPGATGVSDQCVIAHAALWAVYWGAVTLGLVCAGWSVGLSPLPWAAAAGAAVATVILIVSLRREGLPTGAVLRSLILVLLTIAASLALGGATHDFSADGQSYQQQAILAMMQGWNPIAETHYNGPFSLWLSHYAKGPWILSAAVGKIFSIEYGKAVSWLFAISAGGLSYSLFWKVLHLSRSAALVCALLLACNPIFASQIQTFYVDGLVGSVILLAAIAIYLLVAVPSKFLAGAVACCLIIAINLKFTGGPFVIALMGVVWLWSLLAKRPAAAKVLLAAGTAGLVLGGCIGLNPYLTNLVEHQHPFYPLAGSGKVDILTENGGQAFLSHNRFYKAAVSLTSEGNNIRPQNDVATGAAVPKIPGVIKKDELQAFYAATDLRMGGFGPWASLAFFTGIAYVILVVRRERIRVRSQRFLPLVIALALLASALIMPDFWWARYAPQLWTALVFAVVVSFSLDQAPSGRRFGRIALGVIAANTTLVLMLAASNRIMQEADFRAQVTSLQKISSRAPLRMHVNFDSARHRLAAHGVVFQESDTTACKSLDNLRGSDATLCIPDASLPEYQRGSEWIAKLLRRGSVSGVAPPRQ